MSFLDLLKVRLQFFQALLSKAYGTDPDHYGANEKSI